jgi:hypothetical protein
MGSDCAAGILSGGAALVFFKVGDALVEGEGLPDLFEALDDGLEADTVDFFDSV